ncbi:hypothetical protein B5S33_g4036 [[Candida] boidinii]|nr:hypothetical protein B5S30_g3226 [[Candida] boidinii]OWB85371.1 hypothetical protein B5S33_g4036 [[Candida] boidinii]
MKIYLNQTPRSVAILSNGFVLLLREFKTSVSKGDLPRCIIEFVPEASVPLNSFIPVSEALGFLGMISLKGLIFLGFITKSEKVGSVRQHETLLKIKETKFVCLNSGSYDYNLVSIEESMDTPDYSLRRILEGGSFYYSDQFDIVSTVQTRGLSNIRLTLSSVDDYDGRFLWNSYLVSELISFRNRLGSNDRKIFDDGQFLVTITRGFAMSYSIGSDSSLIHAGHMHPGRDNIDKNLPIVSGSEAGKNTNNLSSLTTNYSPATLTIISKQGCKKAGLLFGPYCVDDEGNVANFAETEIVLRTKDFLISFIQTRGNVPLFWKLESNLMTTKIEFPRSEESSQHAFDRHFDSLNSNYGIVHVLDALSSRGNQRDLSERYEAAIKNQPSTNQINYTKVEFSTNWLKSLNANILPFVERIKEPLKDYDAYCYDYTQHSYIARQSGLFMVNTLDSNDKANLIQSIISQEIFELFLKDLNFKMTDEFWKAHQYLWNANGSRLTNLIENYTSNRTANKSGGLVGAVAGKSKQYMNSSNSNVSVSKRHAIDKLLGRTEKQFMVLLYDPIHDFVTEELNKRSDEYTQKNEITIFTGTFNVNAVKYDGDLSPWIFPKIKDYNENNRINNGDSNSNNNNGGGVVTPINSDSNNNSNNSTSDKGHSGDDSGEENYNKENHGLIEDAEIDNEKIKLMEEIEKINKYHDYDIISIGLEEIVELSANKMMNIDPASRFFWEKKIKDVLNNNKNKSINQNHNKNDYVLLRSEQLGGIILLIFVKEIHSEKIKNVRGSVKKTGFGGMSSNKGGVAVAFDFSSTSLCFIASHLAAGFSNVDERHQNYKAIANGLKFLKNRKLSDFEAVIWMGDFNYRITLGNKDVKPRISKGDYSILFEYDQLNQQMASGESFPFFDEMEINFAPTYKFDNGTDTYDTSEKQRVPAWTDRILSKSTRKRILKQIAYDSIPEIKFSDHRPVYGIYKATVEIVDENKKSKIENNLYEQRKLELGDISSLLSNVNFNEVTLTHSLPPPSSKRTKWWIEGGNLVRISFPELDSGEYMINPKLPRNPFTHSDEPDFIPIKANID